AVLGLVVEDGDEDQVYEALASYIGDFGGALERYAPELGRFRQVLHQAVPAAWNQGVALGEAADALAGGFFGRMGAIIAAAAFGMAGGHAVMQQVQAEGERLQQSFGAMLQAYDRAMADLTQAALNCVASYHRDI